MKNLYLTQNHTIYGLITDTGDIYYIGKTNNLRRRLKNHDSEAARGLTRIIAYHKLRKLHKVGIKAITHHIVLEANIPVELIDSREQYYISHYKGKVTKLFNIAIGGEGGKGHTPETNKKAAEKRRGQKRSEQARKNISKGKKGTPLSAEHKAALKSAWLTRKPLKDQEGTRNKRIQGTLGKINLHLYKVIAEDGTEHLTTKGLSQFCRENQLGVSNLLATLKSGKTHKGWKVTQKLGRIT